MMLPIWGNALPSSPTQTSPIGSPLQGTSPWRRSPNRGGDGFQPLELPDGPAFGQMSISPVWPGLGGMSQSDINTIFQNGTRAISPLRAVLDGESRPDSMSPLRRNLSPLRQLSPLRGYGTDADDVTPRLSPIRALLGQDITNFSTIHSQSGQDGAQGSGDMPVIPIQAFRPRAAGKKRGRPRPESLYDNDEEEGDPKEDGEGVVVVPENNNRQRWNIKRTRGDGAGFQAVLNQGEGRRIMSSLDSTSGHPVGTVVWQQGQVHKLSMLPLPNNSMHNGLQKKGVGLLQGGFGLLQGGIGLLQGGVGMQLGGVGTQPGGVGMQQQGQGQQGQQASFQLVQQQQQQQTKLEPGQMRQLDPHMYQRMPNLTLQQHKSNPSPVQQPQPQHQHQHQHQQPQQQQQQQQHNGQSPQYVEPEQSWGGTLLHPYPNNMHQTFIPTPRGLSQACPTQNLRAPPAPHGTPTLMNANTPSLINGTTPSLINGNNITHPPATGFNGIYSGMVGGGQYLHPSQMQSSMQNSQMQMGMSNGFEGMEMHQATPPDHHMPPQRPAYMYSQQLPAQQQRQDASSAPQVNQQPMQQQEYGDRPQFTSPPPPAATAAQKRKLSLVQLAAQQQIGAQQHQAPIQLSEPLIKASPKPAVRRITKAVRPIGEATPPSVDMMTCCVQLQSVTGGGITKALEAFARSVPKPPPKEPKKNKKGADDDDDDDENPKGQSAIERHKLLAWRPPCNPKVNMDIFKSRDGITHSVNVKGAKSWIEFEEATDQLVLGVQQITPSLTLKKNQPRVALTKSSFHLGYAIDLTELEVPEHFAEICRQRRKRGNANKEQKAAKSNGGLVLKLHKWNAKVMLHSNGRGDMWWSTDDVEQMTAAYQELRAALFPNHHH